MLTDRSLLRLLQLTDTAFPMGAFAHSFGLETYVARRVVDNAATLEAFIANTLRHTVAPSDGVACIAAARAGTDWEDTVQSLDRRLTAMKTVTEFRAASRTLGTRFLRTASSSKALEALLSSQASISVGFVLPSEPHTPAGPLFFMSFWSALFSIPAAMLSAAS